MATDQRPSDLPPFFFELSHDERLMLSCAEMFQGYIDSLYRLRGQGRTADERDTNVGRLMELNSWFSAMQDLGDRLNREHAERTPLLRDGLA